jgi:DEAD/DEAH box helicase domain-containing protein
MASATIGKPKEHIQNLTGLQDFEIITEELNGSPIAERSYYLVSPDCTDKSYGYILHLAKALVMESLQFVVFCNSRQEVEKYTDSFRHDFPKLKDRVMPYRAGYQSVDRTAIEKALRLNQLLGVFSTSALEMGIDLPNLDVCIMAGLPNSQSSLLQRAGRVGRRRPGAVVICGRENPFDDYYLRRPTELFRRPLEHMAVNLSNTNLLIAHFACARVESGAFDNPNFDPKIFGAEFMGIADRVNHFDYAGDILYDMEPHFRASIRSIDDPVYTIGVGQRTVEIPIGEINYSQLMREAYFDGIYMHMGVRHRVKKIIFGKREVLVDRRCPFASTKPKFETVVRPKPTARKGTSRLWPNISVSESTLSITEKVTGYVEKSATEEKDVVYQQPLMRYFVTSGVVITIKGLSCLSHGAVIGLACALANAYPIIYRCARTDIGCHAWSKEDSEGHIYLYDSTPGGLGITTNALPLFEQLLCAAADGVSNCDCGGDEADSVHGCIKCVQSNTWLRYPNNTRSDTLNLLFEMLRVLADSQATPSTPPEESHRPPLQRRNYGRTMLSPGSIVYTGTGHEAVVLSSRPMEDGYAAGERLYTVQGASKETKSFVGNKLTLIQGNVELWCLNCGTESISNDDTLCPTCGVRLI